MKKILIIDISSVVHRAYHALPPLATKKGEIINSVYGFLLVFFKAIKDFQPDYIAAAFDFPAPTFRHKKFKEYKAQRPPTPKDLSEQIPKVKEVLKVFDVPIFEKQGFEADDIIGTLACRSAQLANREELEVVIISGDLDLLQLIDEKIKVYHLRKGVKDVVLYDKALVKEKFQGLSPQQVLDFKALKGDASDNIPGVGGIGEKTALELILKFKTVEAIYKEIEENSLKAEELKPRIKDILLKNKKQAFLSKELARINKKVAVNFDIEKCFWKKYSKEKAAQVLNNFEFYSLIEKLPQAEPIKRELTLW